jgi:amidohydrolase
MSAKSAIAVSSERQFRRLLELLAEELPQAVALRHAIHREPELSWQEQRTAALITAALDIETAPAAAPGMIGWVGDQTGVVIRAELDALPLAEASGAEWAATNGAMHACGHDVHCAGLVALTRAAARHGQLPAALGALFQASEERYPSGAKLIADAGLIDPACEVVAVHVHPDIAWGAVGLDAGVVNAANDDFTIKLTGCSTHAAYPSAGADALLAAAHLTTVLGSSWARKSDPQVPSVLHVGLAEAGIAPNVVAGAATLSGCLRSYSPAQRLQLHAHLRETSEHVSAAHGCRAAVVIEGGEPLLNNDAEIVADARQLLATADLAPAEPWRSCGADDFAFLGADHRIAMGFVGLKNAPGALPRPLHNPEFLPPDAAVGAVARAQASLYWAAASARTNAANTELARNRTAVA